MEVPMKVSGVSPEIGILLSDSYDGVFKNFRCVVCGKIVFSYDNQDIRMILSSGYPATARPQKMIECGGTLALYSPSDLYAVLHSLLDTAFVSDDVEVIRQSISAAALVHNDDRTVKCKARYFVS